MNESFTFSSDEEQNQLRRKKPEIQNNKRQENAGTFTNLSNLINKKQLKIIKKKILLAELKKDQDSLKKYRLQYYFLQKQEEQKYQLEQIELLSKEIATLKNIQ